MTGKLYVNEIMDVSGASSPSFPNGLDITELTDPVGAEGEVLTVQADGSILAAAAAGGAGIPITISGIADRTDAAEVGAAVLAALPPLTKPTDEEVYLKFALTDAAGGTHMILTGTSAGWSLGGVSAMSGAGSVLVWGAWITT